MKKMASTIGSILLLIAVLVGFARQAAAGNLQTFIASSNHSYSTASKPQTSDLRIALRPSADVPNSQIEVYLYAVAPTATASDGLADANAFDIGNITVQCPDSIPGVFDFGEPQIITAENVHQHFDDGAYHEIICPYTGTGDVTQADFGYSNDNFLIIKNVINPLNDPTLPSSQLIYSPIWITFQSVSNAQLTITSSRNVQMLAVIVPQLSIELEGLPADEQHCGVTNKYETSGTEANFGNINNLAYTDLIQKLTVTTNVAHGYAVTAIQDDQMRLQSADRVVVCSGHGDGNDGCIPNAYGNSISTTQAGAMTDYEKQRGLGYTLENDYGSDNVFSHTDGYRAFADQQNGEEPVTIMSTTNGRRGVDYICYRVIPTEDNQVGNYANEITYTLTAKF